MVAEVKILLIAMTPIFELRGSIPMAIGVYNLSIWSSYLFSVIGNIIPVIFILFLLKSVSGFLMRRWSFFNRFFSWLFERTRKKHGCKFERCEELALIILVAIPLPFTGAWTGSLCAFVFGIPIRKAFPLIVSGVIIAGVITTLITLGALQIT